MIGVMDSIVDCESRPVTIGFELTLDVIVCILDSLVDC